MRRSLPVAALLLYGCSSAPAPAPESAPVVKDKSAMLPLTGRTSVTVVPNHLLGIPKLPGGTLGTYNRDGSQFQLFIIDTASNQDAAFLLLDVRAALSNPQMIPWMGGYFGTEGIVPVFVFPKLHYLVGVTGLSEKDADPIARDLAARLK